MLSLRVFQIGGRFRNPKTKGPFPSGNGHLEFGHFFAPEARGKLAVVSEAEPPVQTEEDLASRRDAGPKCAIAERGFSSALPGRGVVGMFSGGCASLHH